MLLQQPVLAEQCHDKGLRRRLLRPYPCRSSVACSDSFPQRGEPEKHLLRDVELVFHHSSISNGFHGMACLKWWLFMVAYSMLIAWLQYLKPRITGMNNTV